MRTDRRALHEAAWVVAPQSLGFLACKGVDGKISEVTCAVGGGTAKRLLRWVGPPGFRGQARLDSMPATWRLVEHWWGRGCSDREPSVQAAWGQRAAGRRQSYPGHLRVCMFSLERQVWVEGRVWLGGGGLWRPRGPADIPGMNATSSSKSP